MNSWAPTRAPRCAAWPLVFALAGCASFVGRAPDGGAGDGGREAGATLLDGATGDAGASACGEPALFRGVLSRSARTQLAPSGGAPWEFHIKSGAHDAQGRALLLGAVRGCRTPGVFDAAVIRLTATFAVDASFGRGGVACVPAPSSEAPHGTLFAAALDGAGRIVVAGLTNGNSAGSERGLLARLLDDGTLDARFGTSGVVDYRPGLEPASPGRTVIFYSLLLDGGRIVAAGSSSQPFFRGALGLVARFLEDGSVDDGFNEGRIFSDSTVSGFFSAARGRAGMLFAGSTLAPVGVRVVALDATGARASAFGADGVADHPRGRGVNVRAMGLDASGRIYVGGGRSEQNNDGSAPAVIVRFDERGAPDVDYGERGEAVVPDLIWGFAYEFERAMLVRCDGSLFVGGRLGTNARIARLTPAGAVDPGFGDEGAISLEHGVPAPHAGLLSVLWPSPDGRAVRGVSGVSTNQNQVFGEFAP